MASLTDQSPLFGGVDDDVLTGDAEPNVIHGDAGDDTISGAGGADTLIGGLGDDLLFGGAGANVLYGGGGADILTYDSADANGALQRLFGGEGVNTLVLEFTQDDYLATGVINEVLAYANALTAGENPGDGGEFVFQSFALRAANFSNILIFVDGQPIAPGEVPGVDAVDDAFAVTESGTVTGDVTLNDRVPTGAAVSLLTPPAGGDLTIEADGSFTFSTNGAFEALSVGDTATVTFTYRLSDGDDSSDATAQISVSGENDAPTAGAATANTDENQSVNGDLIADSNAADIDQNDLLSVLSVGGLALNGAQRAITLPSGAVITVAPEGGYSYAPGDTFDALAVGDTATEVISFILSDGRGGQVASSLTLTIDGQNDAPVANPDAAVTTEDEAVTFDVLGNDTDVDQGDVLTLVSIDSVSEGGAEIALGGQIQFVPGDAFDSLSAGANAFVEIAYTMEDASGARSSSTATVTVTGVNDAPTADDVSDATSEDADLTGNLLTEANAADVDTADVLAIVAINDAPFAGGFSAQIASGAMLTVMANGDYSYSPTAANNNLAVGDTASDSFTYTISDGRGGFVVRTFTIDITGENDGPVVQDIAITAPENGVAEVDFLEDSNAFDPDDGGVLTLTAVNGAAADPQTPFFDGSNGGRLTQGLGGFSFDAQGDFEELSVGDVATTTFTFTIEDDQGAAVTRTLTVEVQGENDDPTADPVEFLTDEDTAATGNLLADSGAADIDQNDTLAVTEILADGLADGALNGAERTFILSSGAALTVAPDGTFTFQPSPADQALNPDERNRENFAFRISDGQGGEIIVSAEAAIDGLNDAPTADPITRGALEDDTVSGDLLADSNAADVDNGDALRISEVEGLAIDTSGALIVGADGGTLFVTDLGGYTFNPNGEFEFLSVGDVATSSFSFQIADRFGGLVDQVITFEVAGANDAPQVGAISAATDEDTAFSGNLLIDGNATDVDQNDVLSIDAILFDSPASGPLNGATRTFALPSGAEITVSPDGAYTYDPLAAFQSLPEGASVVDVLTFRIADGNGGVAQQSLTITVDGVNDAPTLDPIAVTLGENASDEGDFIDDSNAADIDQGDTVTVFALEGQDFSAGTVTITRPGEGQLEALGRNYTYETQNDFDFLSVGETATTSYEFTVSDRLGATATTTITFTIVGENDGPTANDIAQSTTEDDILDRNLLTDSGADDVDQSDVLTISRITIDGVGVFDLNGASLTQALANGSVLTVNPDGGYQIDPAGNFEGLAPGDTSETSFNFTVSDGNGGSVERNAVISITGVNDAPVAVDDAFATDQDNEIPLDLLSNDSDVDGEFSLTSFTQPDNGGVVTVGQGLAFSTNNDFDFLGAGEQTTTVFTYTITDDFLATDTADVTITVTGLNDAPVVTPIIDRTDEDRAAFVVDLLAGQVDIDQNDVLSVENFVEIDTTFGDFTVVDGIFTIDARQFDFLDQFDPINPDETSRTIDYSYDVVDLAGARVTNTLRLTIEGRDENVILAVDDAFTTDEDTPLSDDVSLNDTIGAGTITLDQNVGAGVLNLNADGTFTFDPNGEFDALADGDTDSVSFSYIIDDGVQTSLATATIDITGVNDGPVADDVLFETDEDNIVEIDLIDESNAADVDATGPIELDSVDGVFLPLNNDDEIITLLSGAVITARRDGFITYDPNGVFNDLSQDEFGLDSFTFELVDDFGDGISVLADVDILGVNDPVEADDSSFDADEDTGAADNLIGLSNVFDPDVNDVIEIGVVEGVDVTGGVTVTLSSGALLTIGEDGEFTYDTNGQFEGLAVGETDTDSFTYTITDGFSAIDLVSTVTINGANDAVVIDEADSDLADTFTSAGGGTGTGGGAPVVSARTLDGANGFALFGETDAIFSGFAVAGDGDFNGDGFGDVVVGSPSYGGFYATDSGSAFVLFGNGASPQPATRNIPNITPDSDGLNFIGGDLERIATDAAFVGDVNGDGFDDFLVGNGDPQIGGQVGVARLVFGQSPTNFSYQYLDASTSTLFIDSTATYSGTRNIGYSVASAGDVNDDGIGDLIIGAPFTTYTLGDQNFGKAFVVYGQDAGGGGFGATFDLATLDGTNGFRIDDGATDLGSQLGFDVSGVGDVNGDGIDDIFVGSPGVRQSVPTGGGEYATYTTGASYIIFGTDDAFDASFDVMNIDSTSGLVLTEPYSSTRVGQGVAGIGDFNGDGIDDFIVGADYGRNEGAAFVVFGSNTPSLAPIDVSRLEPDEGFKILGGGNYSFVGRAMDAAGDVNGDGFDDVILGAPRDYEGLYVGEAYILFGTDQSFTSPFDLANFDANDGIRLTGFDTGDRFGIRVSGAGDLNEDGFDDVIVGSPTASDERNGAAFVFFGSVGGAATGGEVGGSGSVFFDDVDINDEHVTAVDALNNDDDDVMVDFELITDSTGGFTGEAEWRAEINPIAFDTLPGGQVRTEAFDLTVDDQNGGEDTVRLEVSFLGVNDAPTSQDVTGTTDEDTVFTGGDLFVDGMIDDVDDGDTLRVSQVIIEIDGGEQTFDLSPFPSFLDIRGATLIIGENGQFSVDPRGAFDFLDTGEQSSVSFDYVVEDQAGATSRRSSVTISITGVNDEPTANDDAETTDQDTVVLLDLFENDVDPENDIAITSLDETLTAGVVTIEDASTGSVTYDPNGQFDFLDDGEQATDTFSYTITDSGGLTSTANVTVTITGLNDAPRAFDLTINATEDDTVFGGYIDDSGSFDPDTSDTLVVESVDGEAIPVGGTVVTLGSDSTLFMAPNGTFIYDPRPGSFQSLAQGETGQDVISIVLSDGDTTDVADLIVNVTGANDAPDAPPLFRTTNEDEPAFVVDLLADAIDVDNGDTIRVENFAEDGTNFGSFFLEVSTLTYDATIFDDLDAGQSQIVNFTYDVVDSLGARVATSLELTIEGRDEVFLAEDDAFSTDEDTAFSGDVSINDVDQGGVFSLVTQPTGAISFDPNGSFTYDPAFLFEDLNDGEQAVDTFTYQIDNGTDQITADVTITIDGINDAPAIFVPGVTDVRLVTESVTDEEGGNSQSVAPALSGDGDTVVFDSNASNLIMGDTNVRTDVYFEDPAENVDRASVQNGTNAQITTDGASTAEVSDTGRIIVFQSRASDIDPFAGGGQPIPNNNRVDIYVRDLDVGETQLMIPFGFDGARLNGDSLNPSVSADGRFVAFQSTAFNIVDTQDDNTAAVAGVSLDDVFLHDRVTGETRMISQGLETNDTERSFNPTISADGGTVVFLTANDLVENDTNGLVDVYAYDVAQDEFTLISTSSAGALGDQAAVSFTEGEAASTPSVSANGRYVAWVSRATNLVDDDTNNADDIFVHDRVTGETARASVNFDGFEGDSASFDAKLSDDGRFVTFQSRASNLDDLAPDTNTVDDVYVKDRITGDLIRVSITPDFAQEPGGGQPDISADGTKIAFASATIAGNFDERVNSRAVNDIYIATIDTTGFSFNQNDIVAFVDLENEWFDPDGLGLDFSNISILSDNADRLVSFNEVIDGGRVIGIDLDPSEFADLGANDYELLTVSYDLTDGIANTSGETGVVIVGENDAPTADDQTFEVNPGETISGNFVADDVDGDDLTFSFASAVQGEFSLSEDGSFFYQAAPGQADDVISIDVSDGNGGFASFIATFDVNQAPTFTGPANIPIAFTDEVITTPNNAIDTSAFFSDPEGGNLTFSAVQVGLGRLPRGLAIDAVTGVISGTPEFGEVGLPRIAVTATDDDGVSATGEFWLAIAGEAVTGDSDPNNIVDGPTTSFIDGLGGNDSITGDNNADIYQVRRGDGFDIIDDTQSGGNNRLVMTGYNSDEVMFSRFSANPFDVNGTDVLITPVGQPIDFTEGVLVRGALIPLAGPGELAFYHFDDGVILDEEFAIAQILERESTDGDDDIRGFGTDDTLVGGLGDDALTGGDGSDLYIYNPGDGDDTIRDNGNRDNDIAQIGFDLGDATFSNLAGTNDVILDFGGGDRLTFVNTLLGDAGDGIEVYRFLDQDLVPNDIRNILIQQQATAGDDFILGTTVGDDTLEGGPGDDSMYGFQGNDTYFYRAGDGDDLIHERGFQGNDVLQIFDFTLDYDFVEGRVNPGSQVTFQRDEFEGEQLFQGESVIINFDAGVRVTGSITVIDGINVGNNDPLTSFIFDATGDTLTGAQIRSDLLRQQETEGDDIVRGFQAADTLNGGLGNDLLLGRDGLDVYQFAAGDGDDTVRETGFQEADRVAFTDRALADFDIFLDPLNVNNVIFRAGDDRIEIVGGLVGGNTTNISFFDFTDQTVSEADMRQIVVDIAIAAGRDLIGGPGTQNFASTPNSDRFISGRTGGDTYAFRANDGNDTIFDDVTDPRQADTLDLRGFNSTDFALAGPNAIRFDPTFDNRVQLFVDANNTLDLIGMDQFEQVVFADVTFDNDADDTDGATNFSDYINSLVNEAVAANPNEDVITKVIVNDPGGSNSFTSTAANEAFMLDNASNDQLLFNVSEIGDDSLFKASGTTSGYDIVIDFSGIVADTVLQEDVSLSLDPFNQHHLIIDIDYEDTAEIEPSQGIGRVDERIVLRNALETFGGVDSITIIDTRGQRSGFNDTNEIRQLFIDRAVTAGDDIIPNYFASGLVLRGGGGDDTLSSARGSQRFEFSPGDDRVTVAEVGQSGGGTDTVAFNNFSLTDAALRRSPFDENVLIFDFGNGDVLTISNFYPGGFVIEEFLFQAQQTTPETVTGDEIATEYLNQRATSGDDILIGGNGRNETLDGGTGNDTLDGQDGSDTYIVRRGEGDKFVRETGSGDTDRLVLNVASTSITAEQNRVDPNNIIFVMDDGTRVEIFNFLEGNDGKIEEFVFTDLRSPLSTTDARLLAFDLLATNGNDRIIGGATDDTLRGGLGDDTLRGANGSDTFVYTIGDGDDVLIADANEDAFEFIQIFGVDLLDVNFSRVPGSRDLSSGSPSNDEDLLITFDGFAGSIRIENGLAEAGLTERIRIIDSDLTLTDQDIFNAVIASDVAAGRRIVEGASSGRSFFPAGAEFIFADSLGDLFQFSAGQGTQTILDVDPANEIQRLEVLGYSSTEATFSRLAAGSEDFIIRLPDGDQIIIIGETNAGAPVNGVNEIFFDGDNVTLNNSEITTLLDGTIGTGPGAGTGGGAGGSPRLAAPVADDNEPAPAAEVEDTDVIPTDDEVLVMTGADDVLRLGDGDDHIRGRGGDDALWGQAGDDTLIGNAGADTLRGGRGEDELRGGGGRDKLIGGGDDDVLKGNGGRDMLKGGRGEDDLMGGAGRDVLKGGGGDDRLEGGRGDDRLTGQGGEDTFAFSRGFGSDTLTDFRDGVDLLDFGGHSAVSALGDLTISQVGDNAVVTDGVGGRITLLRTDATNLGEDDFLF